MLLEPFDDRGFVFQVDLVIPNEHHSYLDMYPIAPESILIDDQLISPYSKDVRRRRGFPERFSQRKLAPNLLPKSGYIVHLQNLQCYVRLGTAV